jgi:predicted enzyme related to lactoylglutathione lyase
MASKLNYNGTLNCALSVVDLDKSLRWYQEMLDLEVSVHVAEMGWAELKTPIAGVTLGVSQVEKVEQGGGATLVFGVDDVDSARAQLEAKDVRFDGETQTIPDMVKIATFFDLDGNTFMLAQDL